MRNCTIRECTTPANWMPILRLSADGVRFIKGEATEFPVCNRHKEGLTVWDFLDEKTLHQLRAAMAKAGLGTPSGDHSWIEWRPL